MSENDLANLHPDESDHPAHHSMRSSVPGTREKTRIVERTLVDFQQVSSRVSVHTLSFLRLTTLTSLLKVSVRGSLIQSRTSLEESNLLKGEVIDLSSLNRQELSRNGSSVKHLQLGSHISFSRELEENDRKGKRTMLTFLSRHDSRIDSAQQQIEAFRAFRPVVRQGMHS